VYCAVLAWDRRPTCLEALQLLVYVLLMYLGPLALLWWQQQQHAGGGGPSSTAAGMHPGTSLATKPGASATSKDMPSSPPKSAAESLDRAVSCSSKEGHSDPSLRHRASGPPASDPTTTEAHRQPSSELALSTLLASRTSSSGYSSSLYHSRMEHTAMSIKVGSGTMGPWQVAPLLAGVHARCPVPSHQLCMSFISTNTEFCCISHLDGFNSLLPPRQWCQPWLQTWLNPWSVAALHLALHRSTLPPEATQRQPHPFRRPCPPS
jgi:hypothetical protein